MYTLGQKICLWQYSLRNASYSGRLTIFVEKEVIVTVTAIEAGGHMESSTSSSSSDLRVIGVADGRKYEKKGMNCGVWSLCDDVSTENNSQSLKEAINLYNEYVAGKDRNSIWTFHIMDTSYLPIVPKGDISYCWKHDYYSEKGEKCRRCLEDVLRKYAPSLCT